MALVDKHSLDRTDLIFIMLLNLLKIFSVPFFTLSLPKGLVFSVQSRLHCSRFLSNLKDKLGLRWRPQEEETRLLTINSRAMTKRLTKSEMK